MASDIPENTPDLAESPTTRREQLTQALLDILEGEDSQSEGAGQHSHTSSPLSSLRSSSSQEMLAAFVTMTTRELRELQERVHHHDRYGLHRRQEAIKKRLPSARNQMLRTHVPTTVLWVFPAAVSH